MQHSDILQTIAEIGVAFAGFASLITLIGRSSEYIDSSRLLGMVKNSLMVVAFALFPFVPAGFGLSEPTIWRVSGALFFVVYAAQTYRAWWRLYRSWRRGLWKMRAGYFTFPLGGVGVVCALSAALVSSPQMAAGFYLAGLGAGLSVAGILFLGVFVSFVEQRGIGDAEQR